MNEPSILLADEPTGNLDSKSSAVIMECFEKVVNEIGTTVLVVTHDVFAASYCRKIIFIKDGAVHSTSFVKVTESSFFIRLWIVLRFLEEESMTFKQLVWKMAKSNKQKYIFYYFCNSFAVMFFFLFATIYFNEAILATKELESIEDVLIIPGVALIFIRYFYTLCSSHIY